MQLIKTKALLFIILLSASIAYSDDTIDVNQKYKNIKNTGIVFSTLGAGATIIGVIVMAKNPREMDDAGPFIVEYNPPERDAGLGVLIGGINVTIAELILYGVGKGKLVQLKGADKSISMVVGFNSIVVRVDF